MKYQVSIYLRPEDELTQEKLLRYGYASFRDYVASLLKESQDGFKKNGKGKTSGDNLDVCEIVKMDSEGMTQLASYASLEDVPETFPNFE